MMELLMEIARLSGAPLYILVGIFTGYASAYRIVKLRKQDKKQFVMGILTAPVSFPVWIVTLIVLLAFYRGRKLERLGRI